MDDFALISASASLLFSNGQTTERMVAAVERLAGALGRHVTIIPRWGELVICFPHDADDRNEIVIAAPTGVDMGKVAATNRVIDDLCDGRIDATAAHAAFAAVARHPPVSLLRFAVLAAAGAAALAIIFGATQPLALLVIAISAGFGACVRRWLAKLSSNAFVQPFAASLIAGLVATMAPRLPLSGASLQLIAVCPAMVLVPGAHLLNGAIDLVRTRIALGAARLLYASMTVLVICTGLLAGLSVGGANLLVSSPMAPVPLAYDVLATGVAVAAFGTFFAMPWRMLPIPVAIGMLAHASRWTAITVAGTGVPLAALIACLLAGTIVTPIADRLRMPFAAFAFASVVSLIPGVYLFRMAGGLVAVASLGEHAPPELLPGTFSDGSTAMLIIIAMTFGLIVPRMCLGYFYPHRA